MSWADQRRKAWIRGGLSEVVELRVWEHLLRDWNKRFLKGSSLLEDAYGIGLKAYILDSHCLRVFQRRIY